MHHLNSPFLSCSWPSFQTEAKSKTILMDISLICIRATRKWAFTRWGWGDEVLLYIYIACAGMCCPIVPWRCSQQIIIIDRYMGFFQLPGIIFLDIFCCLTLLPTKMMLILINPLTPELPVTARTRLHCFKKLQLS